MKTSSTPIDYVRACSASGKLTGMGIMHYLNSPYVDQKAKDALLAYIVKNLEAK